MCEKIINFNYCVYYVWEMDKLTKKLVNKFELVRQEENF